MTPVSSANLIAATLQLQLVQSVLGAIRAADRQGAARFACPEQPGDRFCREVVTPEPRFLPRPVIHPTPRYLPRPVIHPTPRIEEPCVPPPCHKAKVPHITAGPQPPWKTLPWQEPAASPHVIKMIVRAPDTVTKGTLVDLFL
jgi:hypothetical protein